MIGEHYDDEDEQGGKDMIDGEFDEKDFGSDNDGGNSD
jgi:hypothetical protein